MKNDTSESICAVSSAIQFTGCQLLKSIRLIWHAVLKGVLPGHLGSFIVCKSRPCSKACFRGQEHAKGVPSCWNGIKVFSKPILKGTCDYVGTSEQRKHPFGEKMWEAPFHETLPSWMCPAFRLISTPKSDYFVCPADLCQHMGFGSHIRQTVATSWWSNTILGPLDMRKGELSATISMTLVNHENVSRGDSQELKTWQSIRWS